MSEVTTTAEPVEPTRIVPSIWTFLVMDSVSFGLFFLVFMVERFEQRELFSESALQLDPTFGLANTLILLTGSLLVALAVASAREGNAIKTFRFLVGAIVVSSGFAILKVIEYSGKLSLGITVTTNDFYTFYYALTGIHLFHYVLGMAALIYLALSVRQGVINHRYRVWLESGALFWHLVDLLWIFLFAMLYLLGLQS